MGGESVSKQALTARLRKATNELGQLERLIRAESGKLDAGVLDDFRQAVDRVRLTAFAAEDFLARRYRPRGPSELLSLITQERIRKTIQL
ncbi:MAG: hypothetical protein HYY26_03425 [Acidobacteria bacterium]|nr:hypothetical protein [Acidobacteriota bacterium]